MRPFEYASPDTAEQAISLLGSAWGQSETLAGGTDLLALMKSDVVHPRRLVNLKNIAALSGVVANAQGVRIGALTTLAVAADNVTITRDYPALADALHEAASPQIRNMATLGGNLCQRPRCWYFRNGFGLLPRSESGADLANDGDNRYHAILGNEGPAKFVSPSSIVPVLIAYGAKVRVLGPAGVRELALEKFYVTPETATEREHALAANEIVTEIVLPSAGTLLVAHYEVRQKAAFDWPLAVAAVSLRIDGGLVQSARVVMGAVAPVPWISTPAEQVLTGKKVDQAVAAVAAEAALAQATPLRHNAYKIQLARVAVKRAILRAAGGAA